MMLQHGGRCRNIGLYNNVAKLVWKSVIGLGVYMLKTWATIIINDNYKDYW